MGRSMRLWERAILINAVEYRQRNAVTTSCNIIEDAILEAQHVRSSDLMSSRLRSHHIPWHNRHLGPSQISSSVIVTFASILCAQTES